MEGLAEVEMRRISTPFGDPSDLISIGKLSGKRVAFLARHGTGHRLLPSEVPSRANIYALKTLGVERIIAINAVGSLKNEIAPLHMTVPDQLIDRTYGRPSTFFGNGLVAHIAFADPICPALSSLLYEAAHDAGAHVHRGGAYVVVDGPAFSTRADSELHRTAATVIGMTALPEAKLAREAEICYAVLACVTDYDCWHPEHESVTVEMILTNLNKNVELAKRIVTATIARMPAQRDCACASALSNAIVTRADYVPEHVRTNLAPIIGKYMG
jgi:5'-methylthioadenosine phosphorylase